MKLLIFIYSAASKKDDDDAQPVKKTYTWNTKEEAKQAFKELLKEKVFQSTVLRALQNCKTCICQKSLAFFCVKNFSLLRKNTFVLDKK